MAPQSTQRLLLGIPLILLPAGIALVLVGVLAPRLGLPRLDWFFAHATLLLYGFLPAMLLFLHLRQSAPRLPRPLDPGRIRTAALLYLGGSTALALGHLLQPSNVFALVAWLGSLAVLAGGVVQTTAFLRALPRRGESVVDMERDPLTKGDDACLKQIRFAHFFLVPGLLLLALPYTPGLAATDWTRVHLAGLHLFLVGYVLLCTYALSHLAIPRYSGTPAIAAGAIKGQLHTTMTGLVLLVAGFLAGADTAWGRGLLVAAGAFVFLGAFVFMGVLGANIMKRKSPTQRVTPEFAYIPWTFAGVLWIVCGILMGLFLNAVPDPLQEHRGALAFTHAHLALLGGFAQLWLAYLPRELAAWSGRPVRPFGAVRWAFLAINAGLLLAILGRLSGNLQGAAFLSGTVLLLSGLLGHLLDVRGLLPRAEADA